MGEEESGVSSSHSPRDEDEEDDDDDEEQENRMLGFMFGNVDNAGDLDVDYLDEDAKEHLAALAEQLESSLTDINLSIKSSHAHPDASEQDYDEKAEDAVDYEDIDEQYEGPEIQATFEEDHLLRKTEYLAAEVHLSSSGHNTSVFDEENYDEDDGSNEEPKVADDRSEVQPATSTDDTTHEEEKGLETIRHSPGSVEHDNLAVPLDDFQEDESEASQEALNEKSGNSLPVLYVEDGMPVLRFSEIFGVHEPMKKAERRNRRYLLPKERYKGIDTCDAVEEDEEAFLRGTYQGLINTTEMNSLYDGSVEKVQDGESHIVDAWKGFSTKPMDAYGQKKDSYLPSEPMKGTILVNVAADWNSPSCPKFCPLDQQDWEDDIIWGNSPHVSQGSSESCIISESDSEELIRESVSEVGQDMSGYQTEGDEKHHQLYLSNFPVVVESLGSNLADLRFSEKKHPQQLRLESSLKVDETTCLEGGKENGVSRHHGNGLLRDFRKLSLQNMDMLEDSWLDKIIWDPDDSFSKPKLILDLQDEHMLFEIPESKDISHLGVHAGAMITTRSLKQSSGEVLDPPGQMGTSSGRFNISNDKYYSNRKTSQQLKSHSKKRTSHDLKVLHSAPALKLQTMKPKLSNKDIANFHRPRALWYPHDNEMALKEQGKLSTQGPMRIILKSLGGKGSKLLVDVEETVDSVKAKASKKLDIKPTEKVKVIYSGNVLDDKKSLAAENVKPNSVLHLVRTKIYLWRKAQRVPGENKPLRPPAAFKKKSDLSVRDGHVFLMEYCEERPLLLGNGGMGARLCTYYQKSTPGDQANPVLHDGDSKLGNLLPLDPADKSPFLGDIRPSCSQSCLETNLYRAPIFAHKLCSTDYLLVRSAKGKLSLRRIDRINIVGQQEPHKEVFSPGTKSMQTYLCNRLLVYIYREFGAMMKRSLRPCVWSNELSTQFPNLSEPFIKKKLKHCADLQRGPNGQLFWVMKHNFRIPLEEELRRMVTPDNVCSYESMQAGVHRLKRMGISRLTQPTGLSIAMNQLPDEALSLAAASHIERELQITPWCLTSNFVACTGQGRESIERLEITGVGDPTGRGLGFSYVRVLPKAPAASTVVKKKSAIPKGGPSVTGTDSDLRRLSMDAAREVLLKFNVSEEEIAKHTRWHRIALVRRLSSEQAASGVKVDPTSIGKYARGQRMSFLQLQQQTREKCQEIWDRQLQSLSAADEDQIDSDSEANSDLDSFAGDLENLLDAEYTQDEEGKHNKEDGLMAEEEIEDEAAEAAELCRMLMNEDELDLRKKKNTGSGLGRALSLGSASVEGPNKTNAIVKQVIHVTQPDGTTKTQEFYITDPKEVERIIAVGTAKAKSKRKNDMGLVDNTIKANGSIFSKKKAADKPTRESFVCGACGQSGHMRTNKNCPRYGEQDTDIQGDSIDSGKMSAKKFVSRGTPKIAPIPETSESGSKTFKHKHGPVLGSEVQSSEPKKISKLIISTKNVKTEEQAEATTKVVIKPPALIFEEKKPRKKVIIKQLKGQDSNSSDQQESYRKTKAIDELSFYDNDQQIFADEVAAARRQAIDEERRRRWHEEKEQEEAEERYRRQLIAEEQQRYAEDMMRRDQERERSIKRKRQKEYEIIDDYTLDTPRSSRRDRSTKRRHVDDSETYDSDYNATLTKRRRGSGEVGLANILEAIVEELKAATEVSYLFIKPVSKKEAPGYFNIVKRPMDLSTIKEKARKLEYKSSQEFRHDVWQIVYNAHEYNTGRNPGIPPLASQLLELCDYLLMQNGHRLAEVEKGIEG